MNPRKGAYRVLEKVLYQETYSNIGLNEEIQRGNYKDQDVNLLTELVYGTLEKLMALNYGIDYFSKVKTKRMDNATRLILQMGAYQILFLDRVPDFAIVNEAGKLAGVYAKRSKGFINGVLRTMIRKKEEIPWPKRQRDFTRYLAVNYSYPKWLIDELLKYYPEGFMEELCKAGAETPPLDLRINPLKTSREEVVRDLEGEGFSVEESSLIPEGIRVKGLKNLSRFKALKEGRVHIQDLSSMLVARVVGPKPGEYIMDLCSAPGGKTTHMAQLMKNKGRIIARDIFPHKLGLIREHSRRLGIDIIETQEFSGVKLDRDSLEKADRVLVDAPCSGLGVIRRKPEIKYRLSPEGLKELQKLQLSILKNAAAYVKPGGVLVYSTCTIHPLENQGVTEAFLREHRDFQPVDLRSGEQELSRAFPGMYTDGGAIALYPQDHGTDGFYIRKFQKK